MPRPRFTGDKREPVISPLAGIERQFIQTNVARVPPWLESYHLTLLTLAWSLGIVMAGWLARGSLHWLWISSLMLFLQWLTDSFDGAVGRMRETGLRRWGYFMDHFLDYVFMACVMGHYAFVMPPPTSTLFLLLVPLYAGFEVNSWLEYGATGKFRITYNGIGPTEIRLFFILVNTIMIFAGTYLIVIAMPAFLVVVSLMLCVTVYQTQRRAWALDMQEKAASERQDQDQ